MNLQYLNLDLDGIPDDGEVQVAVFLIAAELRSKKLDNGLASIGCDGCFCISDLCDLVLGIVGFDYRSDALYDYYFDLLRKYSAQVTVNNANPYKEAYIIYQLLKSGTKTKQSQ